MTETPSADRSDTRMTETKLLAMPVRERNLLTFMQWGGFPIDAVPAEHRSAVLDEFARGFDHFTARGQDFGNAACNTAEWLCASLAEAPDVG